MKPIFIPETYFPGTFFNLRDAMQTNCPDYRITEIVRYNKVYRDYLRQHGMDKTIELLISQMPELANIPKVLDNLRYEFQKEEPASYDVQCVPIDSDISLCGTRFHGLKDIINHRTFIESWPSPFPFRNRNACAPVRRKKAINGLEIIELREGYPCFDSEDYANENRYYSNYIFTTREVTAELIREIAKMKTNANCNLCTEHIPDEFLPIVYYAGEGNYMLVASK